MQIIFELILEFFKDSNINVSYTPTFIYFVLSHLNLLFPQFIVKGYEAIIFSPIWDIKLSILSNFLEKSGKNMLFFFDYLFPVEIKEKTINLGNPMSVVTPEQMKNLKPAVDPHYGHSPID